MEAGAFVFLAGFPGVEASSGSGSGGVTVVVDDLDPFFGFARGRTAFATGGESSSMSLPRVEGRMLLLVVCEVTVCETLDVTVIETSRSGSTSGAGAGGLGSTNGVVGASSTTGLVTRLLRVFLARALLNFSISELTSSAGVGAAAFVGLGPNIPS